MPEGFTEILKNPRQQSTQANKMALHVIKQAVKVLLQYWVQRVNQALPSAIHKINQAQPTPYSLVYSSLQRF